MKQLQKDYTTTEQSKRLLELGLPADSANMYYKHTMLSPYLFVKGVSFSRYSKVEDIIPCWSVGRLIEIELICRDQQEGMIPRLSFIYGDLSENGLGSEYLIENLVTYLEIGQYNYDFSKLEE